jgi:DNA-binding SARP family transcriptional activator
MAHADIASPPSAVEPRWRLRLLGDWQLLDGSAPVPMLHRERLLISYLAVTGSRPRAHVAGVLWPDVAERYARSSLRQAIHAVRRRVPDLLTPGGYSIGLSDDVETDVGILRAWCDRIDRGDVLARDDVVAALRCLRGPELLLGEFSEWVLAERDSLQRSRSRALEVLARQIAADDTQHAIAACELAAQIEPLGEGPATTLMALYLAIGNQIDALRTYQAFRQRLWDEMRTEPSPKMRALLG